MKEIVHLIMWVFIGALCVLVLTHAKGFATATTAVGGQVTNDAYLLSGSASDKGRVAPASWAKGA
jgi:hypothetical protein